MAFLEIGANTLDDDYEIENSCRFNSGDSPKLQLTTGSNGDREKFTFSCWFKVCQDMGADQTLISWNDGTHEPHIKIDTTNEQINFRISDSNSDNVMTNMMFRDYSAWYHLVVAMDTSQSTAANRVKIYVNGTQQTSLATTDYVNQNTTTTIMSNTEITIGRDITTDNKPFDGYIAEVFVVDGTAYAATDFGKTNSNGVWVPIDAKDDITFGTHGFYMEFKQTGTSQNSSGIGADTSGNDNHYAVTNLAATDITTDTPTNNFATLNPLMGGRGSTLSEGNLKVTGESDNNYDVTTFGSDMKWYMEWKVDENYDGSGGGIRLGAIHEDELAINDNFSNFANATAKFYTNSNDGKTQDGAGANVTTGLTRATTNDIIMCACDGAGAKIWWGVNGTWLDYGSGTGDPAAGSNAAEWTTAMKAGIWFPATVYSGTAAAGTLNLGNPPNAISSSQADDAGYGNFEYDVPAGFYALCTKNLAEYG